MKAILNHSRVTFILLFVVANIVNATTPFYALGHGGKDHGGNTFTALQAVQKATALYDRLIGSGKLPEQWETDLVTIIVGSRQSAGKVEVVVQFRRNREKPDSVYFFFSQTGDYTGSNFTGD